MAKKKVTDDFVPHKGKAKAGKTGKRGVSLDPAALPLTRAVGEPVKIPRPARTRYPVSLETFRELKQEATVTTRELVAKHPATAVLDRGRKKSARAAAAPAAVPVAFGNFAGIPATGFIPADSALSAGPNHVIAAVNSSFAIYNKTGGAPLFQTTLENWFSNAIKQVFVFDPKTLYDQHSGRWVLLAVALPLDQNKKGSWFLLSVSKTSDPMGGWSVYALDAMVDGATRTDNWADYPAVGVDAVNLYLTANMFKFGGDFAYAKVRVVPKAVVYSGQAATWWDFTRLEDSAGVMSFTVQPCQTYGAPGFEYLVNSHYPSGGSSTRNKLTLWAINTAGVPSLTKRTITTGSFAIPPSAKQKGGGTAIDTGDVRLLNAVFRGGSVWTALTTKWLGPPIAALFWFQINATSGALQQQGLFGIDGRYYFYPVLMPDTNGNMILCFSRCSTTEFASIYYTGRKASDSAGSLQQPSVPLKAGTANYVALDNNGLNRWGDYNGIAVDPNDNRTVWFMNEFATAGNNWATWIGRVQI